ncbi:hypothetical protein ZIOFF_022828 [Zingiber officinale]|uniref:Potassium channel tetramerisation-type BTB domain-containing protein n=1 Tax=Zingiber officinale TaxID=94328 RepID=A0A8J5LHN2_ZINOF|nr:hypothetical protein ZIOFF_022828 [Zingiber officinale]
MCGRRCAARTAKGAAAVGEIRSMVGVGRLQLLEAEAIETGRQLTVGLEEAEYFINHNLTCFVKLLNLLCTGELRIPPNIPEKLLFREALFYSLLDKVRVSRWGTFDGNHLKLASSQSNCTPGDETVIRADPNGD